MDLTKMMQVAGIGCGEGCLCMQVFASSLDEEQKATLGHMIKRGAEVQLEAIKGSERIRERRQGSFAEFLEEMSGDDGDGHPNLLDMILSALTREHDELGDADPYEGPLGDEIETKLAEVPEDERVHVEHRLRQVIAVKAGNDPTRVEVEVDAFGAKVRIRQNAGDNDESSVPNSEAAA